MKSLQDQAGSTIHAVLNEMETHRTPPTHFKLNKFTQGFQNIIDAYGIATYREVNPGILNNDLTLTSW